MPGRRTGGPQSVTASRAEFASSIVLGEGGSTCTRTLRRGAACSTVATLCLGGASLAQEAAVWPSGTRTGSAAAAPPGLPEETGGVS